MRISEKSSLWFAAVVFGVILIPGSAWAGTGDVIKNCPTEPAQNVAIASGDTYYGSNCVLSTTGDFDSFTFTGAVGQTWSMYVGLKSGDTSDTCLSLYAPGNTTPIYGPSCTNVNYGVNSAGTSLKLTVAGVYTIAVTEPATAVMGYALSLERLSPTPLDAIPLSLSKNVTGSIGAPTSMETYTFYGATTGTYEINSSLITGATTDVCFNVYSPNGTSVLSEGPPCTNVNYGVDSIEEDLTPTENATYLVVVYGGFNWDAVNYNLEVTCILGKCPATSPPCELADVLSYSSGTLTMDFTLGTPVAATWNGWLVSGNTTKVLWSASQPITEPQTTYTKTKTLAASGKVGVLSTLTTPTGGIKCSSWALITTGTP